MKDTAIYNYFVNKHPDIYQEALKLINQPYLNNLDFIPIIYKTLWNECENPNENRHYFFAVLINLYHPLWFTTGRKLKIGLRSAFANAAGYVSPEMVNEHTRRLSAYMKGKSFSEKVISESNRFFDQYHTDLKQLN
jgi:hypothetical protein